jgi:hypothetical protein
VEAELQKGRPVTVIGDKDWPKWYKWLKGQKRSKLSVEDDGTFTVLTDDTALIELLPDPKSARYRVTAQIRHDRSGRPGEVGLFVGHVVVPRKGKNLQFFTELSFNAVAGNPLPPLRRPDDQPPGGMDLVGTSAIRLHPEMLSDDGPGPNLGVGMPGAPGPRIKALGPNNGRWLDVDVQVTPDEITASVGGQPIALAAADWKRKAEIGLDVLKKKNGGDPVVQALRSVYSPRGGIGLILENGTASVRNVVVTPLK